MNLSDFRLSEAPLTMVVMHPVTGEATDAVLSLLSPYHEVFMKRKAEIARDTLYKAMTSSDDGDFELRLTAAAIAGWSGLQIDGVEMVYTAGAAEKILADFPWLREQVVFFTTMPRSFSRNLWPPDRVCKSVQAKLPATGGR